MNSAPDQATLPLVILGRAQRVPGISVGDAAQMQKRLEIAVYLMSDRRYGVIYAGVTSNLTLRIGQHRAGEGSAFTARYNCKRLFWFERHEDMRAAIRREKAIKKYSRQWKVNLIETQNPDWLDLWQDIRPGPLPGQWRSIEETRRGKGIDPSEKSPG